MLPKKTKLKKTLAVAPAPPQVCALRSQLRLALSVPAGQVQPQAAECAAVARCHRRRRPSDLDQLTTDDCQRPMASVIARRLSDLLRRSLSMGLNATPITVYGPAPEATPTCDKTHHHHAPEERKDERRGINYDGEPMEEEEPDVDSGYAWIILFVVFVINMSVLGAARAYGLIFDKLARDHDQSRSEAALPFTVMGTVENMAGPLSGYLLARTNSWRLTVLLGSTMIALAHFLAALSSSLLCQMLSMGLMCGLGMSLITISFFQVNNSYFRRYRSTAFGIGLTGAAVGTLYISPLCQFVLDQFDTNLCYLMLGVILSPNMLLALLLRPKRTSATSTRISLPDELMVRKEDKEEEEEAKERQQDKQVESISRSIDAADRQTAPIVGMRKSIKYLIGEPMFHMIWLTQLLFCWLNFVFGMILIDFAKDRGFGSSFITNLLPIWAFGQLFGRMILGSLVDLKLISYKNFTSLCFASIAISSYLLNHMDSIGELLPEDQAEEMSIVQQVIDNLNANMLAAVIVFTLSAFIALLYILFNCLVVNYIQTELQPLSIGISSFVGSFLLLPRASLIGHYRDTTGNYDAMLTMFSYVTLAAAFTWLTVPFLVSKRQAAKIRRQNNVPVQGEPSFLHKK